MNYHMDFSKISLNAYREMLLCAELIPSQAVLKEDIEGKFQVLKDNGVQHMAHLLKALKTKAKISLFAKSSGLPEDYLIVLARAAQSLEPPPRSLADYPGITEETVQRLEKAGIKNSVQAFEAFFADGDKTAYGLSTDETVIIKKISGLCRLRYVSPVFANLLIAAGTDTIEKVAQADAAELYEKIRLLNADNHYFKGNIGLKDIRFLIFDANFFKDRL